MKRKSEHKGLFSGLTFSSAMILFGVMLASGAIVGLVASGIADKKERVAQRESTPPQIRAVHIKPDLTQVKREQPGVTSDEKRVLMTPAMLRQMSHLEQRLGTLENQIRSLSKSNLDLAEKMDTSGLDNRLEALEDTLQNFTASIDKRIKENERRVASTKPEELPGIKETDLTSSERKLLPPPFKTDEPEEVKAPEPVKPEVQAKTDDTPAPEPELSETQQKEPTAHKEMMKKAAELAKPKPAQKKEPTAQKAIMEKAAELAKPKQAEPVKTAKKPTPPEPEIKYEPKIANLNKGIVAVEPAKAPDPTAEKETVRSDGKTGWEPVITYHNVPKKPRMMAALQKKPRFTTAKSSPEVTGSVAKPRVSSKPQPRKKRVRTPFAVHIASASTLYQVKDSWLTLQRDNGILRNLRPHIVSASEGKKPGSVPWKLLAGPLASEDEAARICTRLNAKGNFCRRTTLSGHPLKL